MSLSPHRTQFGDSACDPSIVVAGCDDNAWVRSGNAYDLFFVEFDDQGLLYPKEPKEQFGNASNQIELTLEKLRTLAAAGQSLSLVVYVHGWKHDASAEDSNVREFHRVLKSISIVEDALEPSARRKVVGIYMAWRGLGARIEPFKEASFYSRKLTAQRVAEGSARYLLTRLRTFQRAQNCKLDPSLCQPDSSSSAVERVQQTKAAARAPVRMLIIGHSFGGLIVFNAISGSLIESLTEEGGGTRQGSSGLPAPQRFGDMVILLNPAFEATRYTPLHRVATGRDYSSYQAPLLVALTSTADRANRVYFPWGRRLSTMFELKASPEEEEANINTMGNMDGYITHDLTLLDDGQPTSPDCKDWKDAQDVSQMQINQREETKAAKRFFEHYETNGTVVLKDGWEREFCGRMKLTHRVRVPPEDHNPPNTPIWNVRVDGAIISSHNDIDSTLVTSFFRQLYQDVMRPNRSQ